MKTLDLNLARRPFVNARPVRRLAVLLWLLAVGLLAVNGRLYWQYFSHTDDNQQELEALEQQIRQNEARITAHKSALAKADLSHQNAQVDFLNRKIAERAFPWSRLFDHMEEVLPNDVRLQSLSPNPEDGQRRGEEEVLPGGRVRMRITAIARTVEAELEFVDRLFAHPSFERPRLLGDSTVEGGNLRFNLQVTYLPHEVEGQTGDSGALEARKDSPPAAADTPVAGTAPTAELSASVTETAPPSAMDRGPSARRRASTASGRPQVPQASSAKPVTAAPPPSATATAAEEAPPPNPLELARRNRRRPSTSRDRGATTSQEAPGGVLVLPQATGQNGETTSSGSRGGSATVPQRGSSRRPPGPGFPVPGDEDGGGSVPSDPRDPRRPSPRAPSASSTPEVQ
ncbi:MAG: hypothetical protein KDD47_26810 [Acidobacteria bacterium]|nr:hypothetical protein [Acidobacteriota bacterium]